MPDLDENLVTFHVPVKHLLTGLHAVPGFQPCGRIDMLMVVKQFNVCACRLHIGMAAGQGDVGHDGIIQHTRNDHISPFAANSQWKVRYSEPAFACDIMNQENPLQIFSSQRISRVGCPGPGLTVRVSRTSR